MNITKIQAHAGVTFNHPYESYSNFRPGITIEAELDPGDDPTVQIGLLQAQAHEACELQRLRILARLEEENEEQNRLARIRNQRRAVAIYERSVAEYEGRLARTKERIEKANAELGVRSTDEGDEEYDLRQTELMEKVAELMRFIPETERDIATEKASLAKAQADLAALESGEEPEPDSDPFPNF